MIMHLPDASCITLFLNGDLKRKAPHSLKEELQVVKHLLFLVVLACISQIDLVKNIYLLVNQTFIPILFYYITILLVCYCSVSCKGWMFKISSFKPVILSKVKN